MERQIVGVIEQIENGDRCPYCGRLTEMCSANDFFNTNKNMKGEVKFCRQCDAFAYDQKGTPHRQIATQQLIKKRQLCVQYYNCMINKKLSRNKSLDLKTTKYKLNGWISKTLGILAKKAYPNNFTDALCDDFIKEAEKYVTPEELVFEGKA